MKSYHTSQTEEIASAIAAGAIFVQSAGGKEARLYETPDELARGLGRRYKASYCIVGRTLYTVKPGAFVGKGGRYVKWSAQLGGWNRVEGIFAIAQQTPEHNYYIKSGGRIMYCTLPENHPATDADWVTF